jgi:isopropylmalate/homocitrate/citramalate synthase
LAPQNEKTPVAGNVATEDVVYMLEGMRIATGVDMQKLVAATNAISRLIGRPPVKPCGCGDQCEEANDE